MNRVPRPRIDTASLVALTWTLAFPQVLFAATPVVEDPESPLSEEEEEAAASADDWADAAPASADAPPIRNVEPRTRIYLDGTYAETYDLSALPNIAGKGVNWRLALGGSLRWRRFQFDIELPASQMTTLDLVPPTNSNILIPPEDAHQTAMSIGDLRLGAQWTHAFPVQAFPLVGGFGLRGRIPTHTTTFQFHLVDGSLGAYVLPYYFHIEPTLLLGGAWGPVSFVMNQGALILMGPDADYENLPIVVPTIAFWDAHYALAWRPVDLFAVSCEVNTTIQLTHVDGIDFSKLNDVRAVAVLPGLQVHLGLYRVDLLARIGVTKGAELLGVVGYSGTHSLVLRVSRRFE